MKVTLAVVKIAWLGLAAATPFSSPNEPDGLEGRGYEPYGKCKWKDSRCCKPTDDHPYPDKYPGSSSKEHHTIYVKSGKSIQHALNSASCGDQIVVAAGIYAEQLTIKKDGIQLIGHNAVLVPPKTAVKNACSGLTGPKSQAGICITGSGVKLASFISEHRKVLSVKKPIKGVLVTGFQVKQFSGANIAVLGAKNTRVIKNTLTDGGSYGALTVGSVNTIIAHNTVSSTGLTFIGICMDNFSDVLVSNNKISNQIIGLCVQTPGSEVQYNKVTNSCFGAFVDPGVKGAKLHNNYIGPSNPGCRDIGVSGIILDGSIKAEIRDNIIEGQKNNGMGAGIVVVDDQCKVNPSLSCIVLGHPAIATGNVIIRNTFRNNDYDIFVNTTGTGNVVKCNSCKTPEKYCGK